MIEKRHINRLRKIKANNSMTAMCLHGALHNLRLYAAGGSETTLAFALANLRMVIRQVRLGECRLTPCEIEVVCDAISYFGGVNDA